jgi:recombination protein RecT
MATTAVATKSQQLKTLYDLVEKNKAQIKMALPKHMSADRVARIFFTQVRRTPKLLECDLYGLVGKLIQASQLGLEIDNLLGSAYLVPFRNNRTGRTDCELIPGYKGLIDLAMRTNRVEDIYAEIIWEKEDWNMEDGTIHELRHKRLPPSQRGSEWVGVYAVAKLKDSEHRKYQFLWREEVDAIKKASSKSAGMDSSPWNQWPEQMIKKTAIRQLAKLLPLSPEFVKAAAIDEAVDVGLDTREVFFDEQLGDDMDYANQEAAQKTESKAEALKEKLTAQTQKQPEQGELT